ncbi:helix-hairpin-helix domain-containing protein [Marilutibacter aestuarii]|uniref:Mitomycin resistance protein n=1 Tax=Marilutibacter aestuarii TaxID=1706195 RepID=A0A508AI65_9GAMM|nr:helix-hairpin-helix domain-containing protein [Lysobacter aestuarii]TQD48261.1 mitomycin resistance protein [Lysobacter aestuarii]
MAKARTLAQARRLVDIPNIGPAMAGDLRALGIDAPSELRGKDPTGLYLQLCRLTGLRQDPCVLDTFMAAVAFAENDDARPWWAFTDARKRDWPAVEVQRRTLVSDDAPTR